MSVELLVVVVVCFMARLLLTKCFIVLQLGSRQPSNHLCPSIVTTFIMHLTPLLTSPFMIHTERVKWGGSLSSFRTHCQGVIF